jgi:hypothetical protein
MQMRTPAAMSVQMQMPGEHRGVAADRDVERVITDRQGMAGGRHSCSAGPGMFRTVGMGVAVPVIVRVPVLSTVEVV